MGRVGAAGARGGILRLGGCLTARRWSPVPTNSRRYSYWCYTIRTTPTNSNSNTSIMKLDLDYLFAQWLFSKNLALVATIQDTHAKEPPQDTHAKHSVRTQTEEKDAAPPKVFSKDASFEKTYIYIFTH